MVDIFNMRNAMSDYMIVRCSIDVCMDGVRGSIHFICSVSIMEIDSLRLLKPPLFVYAGVLRHC